MNLDRASIFAVLFLVSCATPPEKIQAQFIDDEKFSDWPCSQLTEVQKRNWTLYAHLAKQQRETVAKDAIGVAFIGIPTGTAMGEDLEETLAKLKGEDEAIRRVKTAKHCD